MAYLAAAERRRQIIEAAARVIGREGVARATTRRIGAEASANIGTLHYTFGGKEDLLDATFAYCWDVASEIVDAAVKAGAGPNETAREVLTRYVELAIAEPDLIAAQYQLLSWAIVDETRKDAAISVMGQLDELVQEALQQTEWAGKPVSQKRFARIVGAVLDGLLLRFIVARSEEELRADLATAIEFVDASFAGMPTTS